MNNRFILILLITFMSICSLSCKKDVEKKEDTNPLIGSWELDHIIIANSSYNPVLRTEIANLEKCTITFNQDFTYLENDVVNDGSTTQMGYTIIKPSLRNYNGPINFTRYSIKGDLIELEMGYSIGGNLSSSLQQRKFSLENKDLLKMDRKAWTVFNPRTGVFPTGNAYSVFVYKRMK